MSGVRAGRTFLHRWAPPLATLAALVLAWELVVRLGTVEAWLLPPPSAIPAAVAGDGADLLRHTLVTLSEVVLGIVISVVIGILTAIAIAFSPIIERALYPLVVGSQTVPIPVIAPLLIIFLGYGLTPKILLVVLICFFPIVVNTVDGLRSVDREAIDLLRTFGAGHWQIFTTVRWPATLPAFFTGLRLAAAYSVIGAVFGELIGATSGLGYYIRIETPKFKTAEVYGATLILVLMGTGLFLAVRGLEWAFLPWQRARHDRTRD